MNQFREDLAVARAAIDLAKREPGHSPTEDALIDSLEAVLDAAEAIADYLEKTEGA